MALRVADFDHLQTELLQSRLELAEARDTIKHQASQLGVQSEELKNNQLQLHQLWESNELLKNKLTEQQLGVTKDKYSLQNVFDHIDNKPQTQLEERLVEALRGLEQYKQLSDSLKQSTKALFAEKQALEEKLSRPTVHAEAQTVDDEVPYSEGSDAESFEEALSAGNHALVLQISQSRDRTLAEATEQAEQQHQQLVSLKRRNAQLALQWQERHLELQDTKAESSRLASAVDSFEQQLSQATKQADERVEAEARRSKELEQDKAGMQQHIDALSEALEAATHNETRLHKIWSEAITEAEMAEKRASSCCVKIRELEDCVVMLRAGLTVKEEQLNELRNTSEDIKNALALEVSKRVSKVLEVEEAPPVEPTWNLWG